MISDLDGAEHGSDFQTPVWQLLLKYANFLLFDHIFFFSGLHYYLFTKTVLLRS